MSDFLKIAEYFGYNKSLMARMLKTSPRSIGRWMNGSKIPLAVERRVQNICKASVFLKKDETLNASSVSSTHKKSILEKSNKNMKIQRTEMISIRLDKDVLDAYREVGEDSGIPYQRIIKNLLRVEIGID